MSDQEKLRFILFRNDGRVRVFTNKRPPVGQGPVVVETEDLKRKMLGIPYNRWKFNAETKEVYSAEPRAVNFAALLIPEDEPLPKFEVIKAAPVVVEKPAPASRTALFIGGAAAAGAAMGYMLKLLLDLL